MAEEVITLITCRRCSLQKPPSSSDAHLCEDCVKAENSRLSYYRQHNFNWVDTSKEAGLEVWERQPLETDREWQVWLAYRDTYPAMKPTYKGVAEQIGCTYNVVKKVAQRWDFPMRMQAWAKYVDELTMQQRTKEILAMNAKHISMATKLNGKLEAAIDLLDPREIAPRDLNGLLKLTTELERKARLDTIAQDTGVQLSDENPNIKVSPTKTDDMQEVLAILVKAGVIPGQTVGVKKTVTTEVVMRNDNGD